jgi:metal-responsive CopG/Arc/MetJ family transcriptional regulator
MAMRRTTVYLEDEIAVAIRNFAESQNRSQAEIIREALEKYVREAERVSKRPPISGVGAYRSGRSDISERAEDILSEQARKKR